MKLQTPALSRALLILGLLMILTGAGWGVSQWVNRPPDPQFTDAGAVVLAVTAQVERPTQALPTTLPSYTPTTTPAPTDTPASTVTQSEPGQTAAPTGTPPPTATPTPAATATPRVTYTPSPTPWPTNPPAANPPTRIVAPAIKLDAEVTTMSWRMTDSQGVFRSQWVVPKNAAGWHVNSALPGHDENVVLSGHHNIDGKVFRYVVDLEPGERVTLFSDGRPYDYWVTEKYILKEAGMPLRVRRQNAQWILPTGDERLTLVTCWPYEWPGNTHRVIVVARPAAYFWELGQEIDTGDGDSPR